MSIPQDSLLTRLGRADVVCRECGDKYGKYSVGCSSVWNGTCGVCGEDKHVLDKELRLAMEAIELFEKASMTIYSVIPNPKD